MIKANAILLLAWAMAVGAVFEDGGVSGDNMEHWNLYPLTRPIVVSSNPVQAIHLALQSHYEVRITWMSPVAFAPNNSSTRPLCVYGETNITLDRTAEGASYSYTAGYFNYTLHTVVLDLSNLADIYEIIYYKCGNPSTGMSPKYNFQLFAPTVVNFIHNGLDTQQHPIQSWNVGKPGNITNHVESKNEKVKMVRRRHQRRLLALVADLGVTHGTDTMDALQEFVQSGLVKIVVHAGDISYADNFSKDKLNNSYIWVEYMNEISSFTPWVPYMTCPGNHEAQFNFAAYLNWLPMPYARSGSNSPFWGSFVYMGVHFVSMSTEHDFSPSSAQHRFIENDLNKANENRHKVPWIIVFGHRPLYCSSAIEDRCTKEAPIYRGNIEQLFHDNLVDAYVCGHNHNYERSYPVFNETATQKNFVNPQAPVYIVNGEAGNPEPNIPSFKADVDWRANFFNSTDNGFLLLEPTKNTLTFQFVRSKDREVMDTFTISKTRNG